ncbi:hypothetical protein IKP85_05560, partial [bacterium]|nr:hypothetical protein [bacterium]
MFTQQNTNNSQNQTAYQQTGKTPVGAFYLHKKPYEEKTVNPEEVQGIKNKITNALSSMKDNLSN